MESKIVLLTLEQILAIHQDFIEEFGGSHGLRDLSLLESAVYRPQSSFSGEDLYPTIFSKAAALMHSLILNHAFIDGNKRTGTAAGIIFLAINHIDTNIDQKKIVEITIQVATKNMNIEDLTVWLEKISS